VLLLKDKCFFNIFRLEIITNIDIVYKGCHLCVECWSCKETVEHGGSLALGRLYHKVNNKTYIMA
jgi:hypothetical protein